MSALAPRRRRLLGSEAGLGFVCVHGRVCVCVCSRCCKVFQGCKPTAGSQICSTDGRSPPATHHTLVIYEANKSAATNLLSVFWLRERNVLYIFSLVVISKVLVVVGITESSQLQLL